MTGANDSGWPVVKSIAPDGLVAVRHTSASPVSLTHRA